MKIWKQDWPLEALNAMSKNTLVENLGIEFTEIGDDYLKARMPVDNRTVQPFRLLHGGASVSLAETIGSIASTLMVENPHTHTAVGVEINANHLRSARTGWVEAEVKPLKLGKKFHVWRICIHREDGKQVCEVRFTVAVIDLPKL